MSDRAGDDPIPRAGGGSYRKTPTQLASDPAFTATYASGVSLPSSNGSDDTAALNTVLAAAGTYGVKIYGKPGQNYRLSTALLIPSGVTLEMTGCTVTGPAADNFIKNTAAIAARTVTDAATTATSGTVTSATANFTAGDVGKAVGVLGAGPKTGLSTAPGALYGTITAVNSATSVTLSVSATTTLSGATLSVFPARDTNITIIGGTWAGQNKDAVNQTTASHGFYLRRVDGLAVRDLTLTSVGTQGIGGRYAISLGDVTNVAVNRVTFSTAGDGLHVQGPARSLSARDLYGTTGDDMVSFTCVDGQTQAGSLLGDVEGDITNAVIDGVYPTASWCAVKQTSGIGANSVARSLSGVTIKNIKGNTTQSMIAVVDYAGTTTWQGQIESVSGYCTNNGLVQLKPSNIWSANLTNIGWTGTTAPTTGIVEMGNNAGEVHIRDLWLRGNPTGTNVGVYFPASAAVARLTIDGLYAPDSATLFYGIQFAANTASCQVIMLNDVYIKAAQHNVIFNAGAPINRIMASNGRQWNTVTAGTFMRDSATCATVVDITVTNWYSDCNYWMITQRPTRLQLDNVSINGSSNLIQVTGTAATPCVLRVGNLNLLGAGALLSRDGTQSIRVTGAQAPVDQAILTPSDGDIVNNTNATPLNGTGVAIYNTAATKWKNLYTGTTS